MSVDEDLPHVVSSGTVAEPAIDSPVGSGSGDVTDEPHEAGPEPASDTPESVATDDDLVPVAKETLTAMTDALERFHGRAEQYETIIRRMQNRVEELQSDQVRELLKPVIIKLATLHTEASAGVARASGREDDSARKDFDYFVSEIEETLGLLDIESLDVSPLDEFDPARHAARRRVETSDPGLDRRVERVLRQGFTYIGSVRTLVPAMVTVYRFVPPADSIEDGSASELAVTVNTSQNEGEL